MVRKLRARATCLEEPRGLLVKELQSKERATKTNLLCGHSDLGDQEWKQEDREECLGILTGIWTMIQAIFNSNKHKGPTHTDRDEHTSYS